MLSTIIWSQLILTLLSSQTMNYVIDAASIFLGKWCGFTLYKENKKVVMKVMCYAFRNFFSESGQMDLAIKGQRNFPHAQIHYEARDESWN